MREASLDRSIDQLRLCSLHVIKQIRAQGISVTVRAAACAAGFMTH